MGELEFSYRTIEVDGSSEFKDRGSKFFGFCYSIQSIDDFKVKLKALKELHPKAVHFCSAYRIGYDGNLYRASDDGEPSGSAGRPILGQIDSLSLTNVAVIVVRYFGGTLLGVPGLINAYKTTTLLALESCNILEKQIELLYKISFDYTLMNVVMQIIKQYNCSIQKQEMQLFCDYEIGIQKKQLQETVTAFNNVHGLIIQEIKSIS